MSQLAELFDSLPPGIAYLFFRLSRDSIFPFSVYLASILAQHVFGINLPTWLVIGTAISIIPLVLIVSVSWETFNDKRKARALGAVMAPQVPSKRFAGSDVLEAMDREEQSGYLGASTAKWIEDVGHTYCVRVFFISRIITDEPEYTKMILATNFDDWEKGPSFRSYMNSLLGTGVFNSDGDMWRFHRSMTRPFFTRDRISHFDIFDRHAEDVINQIRNRLNDGIAVDIQDAFSRFTLDSASEFLFGTNVRSLSAGLPFPATASSSIDSKNHPANVFAESFLNAQDHAINRTVFGDIWPLFEFWEDKVKKEMKKVYSFIDPIVKEVLEKKKLNAEKHEVDEDSDMTMLEHLVQLTDDPVVLRDETLNILVAGRDTTTSLMTFAVYVLGEHPRVLERLRQEILETVGPSARPSPEDLKNMKYLRAVLNETLRLFPPVPFNTRTPNKPVLLPSLNGGKPIYIPKNTRCHYAVFHMHRRQDLWGPDALEFDPDRFLDDRVQKYLVANPFIFLPFNAGPRICVGQQFSYNEASFMLVRLLQAFKSIRVDSDAHPPSRPPVEWATGKEREPIEKVWMKSHLTSYVHKGLWVKMIEA